MVVSWKHQQRKAKVKTYTLEITETEANIIRQALISHSEEWIKRSEAYRAIGDTTASVGALNVALNNTSLGIKVLEAIS